MFLWLLITFLTIYSRCLNLASKKNGRPDIAHASGRIWRLSICIRPLSSIRLRLSNTRLHPIMPPWLKTSRTTDMLFLFKRFLHISSSCLDFETTKKHRITYHIGPRHRPCICICTASGVFGFSFLFLLRFYGCVAALLFPALSKIPIYRSLLFSFVGHLSYQWPSLLLS